MSADRQRPGMTIQGGERVRIRSATAQDMGTGLSCVPIQESTYRNPRHTEPPLSRDSRSGPTPTPPTPRRGGSRESGLPISRPCGASGEGGRSGAKVCSLVRLSRDQSTAWGDRFFRGRRGGRDPVPPRSRSRTPEPRDPPPRPRCAFGVKRPRPGVAGFRSQEHRSRPRRRASSSATVGRLRWHGANRKRGRGPVFVVNGLRAVVVYAGAVAWWMKGLSCLRL